MSGIDRVAEDRRAEIAVPIRAARVAAGRTQVLRVGVEQVAIRDEVAVGVGPGACHVLRDARGRVREPVVRRRRGRIQILPKRALERRLAVAEEIVGGGHAWREVVIGVDDRRFLERERRRQEALGTHTLRRRPAPRTVVPQRALEREAVDRPLLLHEEGVVPHPQLLLEVVDELRQLVGHAVVDAVLQVVATAIGQVQHAQHGAGVAELEAPRSGDVCARRTPRIGDVLVARVAEDVQRLRSIVEARDVPVHRAAGGALLDHPDEVVRVRAFLRAAAPPREEVPEPTLEEKLAAHR